MITIIPPKIFNFTQTVSMLQRGPNDPINCFEEGKWTRCFRIDNEIFLIQTQNKKTIQTKLLQGKLSPKAHKELIQEALGLDDPILCNQISNIPFADQIESVLGLSVPGYPDIFEALVQIIMGQQVSVAVANKVRGNFAHALGGVKATCNQFLERIL
jgi:3-methyladenine DNA glycosylase/8-oxoguanine DNA glycosylase